MLTNCTQLRPQCANPSQNEATFRLFAFLEADQSVCGYQLQYGPESHPRVGLITFSDYLNVLGPRLVTFFWPVPALRELCQGAIE
jgi:hypothetical protein